MAHSDGDALFESESRQHPHLLRSLEMIAPGTALREGIDNIMLARTGALLAVAEPDEISHMLSGGLRLDIDYSPAFLYQLAKMDGAIVLNVDATRILWANVQLMPDPTITSSETGTRHRTAERVSKQTSALVLSVSKRRDSVSLYVEGGKYILTDIPSVLAKANQALATLEKYRARLDRVTGRLDTLEFEGSVALYDALTVLQRAEMVTRMAAEVERYVVELGSEARLIEMQLEELMTGTALEKVALLRDYAVDDSEQAHSRMLAALAHLPHHDLLDFGRLAELLGHDRKTNSLELPVSTRGYRVLGRIPRLPRLVVQKIIHELGGLSELLAASETDLAVIEGVGESRARDIIEGLRRQQEMTVLDRYLQT